MVVRTVDIDGPVVYADHGGDGPSLLLLHGIGGAKVNSMLLAPLLTPRFHVYAMDFPGFGDSPLAGRSADLPPQVEIVARFVAQVCGGAAVLAGHSMGGLVAMMTAAAHPGAAKGLVLFDPAFPPRAGSPAPVPRAVLDVISMAPAAFSWAAALAPRVGGARAAVVRTLRSTSTKFAGLPAEFIEAHVAAEQARMRRPGAYLGYLQAWASFRRLYSDLPALDAMVRSVHAPTLLVHGAEDAVVLPAAARHLAALQPSWRLELLEEVGHNPNFEAPELTASLVLDWAREASLSSR
ncbi:MAG: alpha/beta fold hydrolase [Candidatus Dormibacteria bacterium]